MVVGQFYAKHGAGQHFGHCALEFNRLLFCHVYSGAPSTKRCDNKNKMRVECGKIKGKRISQFPFGLGVLVAGLVALLSFVFAEGFSSIETGLPRLSKLITPSFIKGVIKDVKFLA